MNNFKSNNLVKFEKKSDKELLIKTKAEFASEFLDTLPFGNINKNICGCGLTTVALENEEDVIICMPTTTLIHNKVSQYPNKRCSYKLFPVLGGVIIEDIRDYISWCRKKGQPVKIISTFDSAWKLEEFFKTLRVVIDESQVLFSTLSFKERRENIMKSIRAFKKIKEKLTLISATPLPDEYVDWFQDIPKVNIEWDNTIDFKPIEVKVGYPLKWVRDYLIGGIEKNGYYFLEGVKVRKLIVFVNSVQGIKDIIRKCKLNITDCAVICGDSVENDIKLKYKGKMRSISRYKPGQEFKYLFATSSGFSGIDLYDKEALTVVTSYTTKDHTILDMMTDIKQAVSRNRDKSNRFYGRFLFVFNQSFVEMEVEELERELYKIERDILDAVDFINKGLEEGRGNINNEALTEGKLKDKYVYINKNENRLEYQKLVFLSELYQIKEVRRQYLQGFKLNNLFNVSSVIKAKRLPVEVSFAEVAKYFKDNHKNGVVKDWDKYINYPDFTEVVEECYRISGRIIYNITEAKEVIDANGDEFKNLIIEVRKAFKVGRYTNKEIRETLNKIYKDAGLDRKAKPNDLYEFFGNGKIKPYVYSGTRGMEILRK